MFGFFKKKEIKFVSDRFPKDLQDDPIIKKHINGEEAGQVRGKHYSSYGVEVSELKKAGKTDQSIELLFQIILATEREAAVMDWGVAPGWYEKLAVIYRQQKDYDNEINVLNRLLSQANSHKSTKDKINKRLKKALELQNK